MKFGTWANQEAHSFTRFIYDLGGLFSCFEWVERAIDRELSQARLQIEEEQRLQRANEMPEKWWEFDGWVGVDYRREEAMQQRAQEVLDVRDNIRDVEHRYLATYAASRTLLILDAFTHFLLWPVVLLLLPIMGFFLLPIAFLFDQPRFQRTDTFLLGLVTSPLWLPVWAFVCALVLAAALLAIVASVFYIPFVALPRKLALHADIENFKQRYNDESIRQCNELINNPLRFREQRAAAAAQQRDAEAARPFQGRQPAQRRRQEQKPHAVDDEQVLAFGGGLQRRR
jgi:hypothetical protein